MAIFGVVCIEDVVLQFTFPETPDEACTIMVREGVHGEVGYFKCSPRAFAASLALALDWEGMDGSPAQDALYEHVAPLDSGPDAPKNPLRWFP